MKKPRALAALLPLAAALAIAALSSCAGIPQAMPALTDAQIVQALPPDGILYLGALPPELPMLMEPLLSRLTEGERKEADRLVDATRQAWLALDRPPAEAGTGKLPGFSAILLGSYPASRLRMGLSASKGVVARPGWFLLPNGVSVAVLSGRRIAATTGDMDAFLDRIRAVGRGDAMEGHASRLYAKASEDMGKSQSLIALSPDPLSVLFTQGASDFIDLPVEEFWMAGSERAGRLELELRFDFSRDETARAFTPAVRIMAGVLRLALGPTPGAWTTNRSGRSVITEGLSLDASGVEALLSRFIQ